MNPFIHRQAATDNIRATIRVCYSAAAGLMQLRNFTSPMQLV
jgi:hypothetical protein